MGGGGKYFITSPPHHIFYRYNSWTIPKYDFHAFEMTDMDSGCNIYFMIILNYY